LAKAISAQNIEVVLHGRTIVKSVSFEANEGEIFCVLGPNGAGKTTLLKAVMGLLPYGGTVQINGVDAGSIPRRLRAQQIAYVPQRSELNANIRVETVVQQGTYCLGEGNIGAKAAVLRACESTDVQGLMHQSYQTLSGGERRRVLIARALASGAKTIVLDEPTAALDVKHSLNLFSLLKELSASGYAILCVLHNLNDALENTDRCLLLGNGKAAKSGHVNDVLTPDMVRQIYGVEMVEESRFSFRL
jgi:iron complex transport system ATP-binding protein